MKHSKELTKWLRKRCWAVFMEMTPKMRKFVYNNSFESFCKTFIPELNDNNAKSRRF